VLGFTPTLGQSGVATDKITKKKHILNVVFMEAKHDNKKLGMY